jgi:hypothetical protein
VSEPSVEEIGESALAFLKGEADIIYCAGYEESDEYLKRYRDAENGVRALIADWRKRGEVLARARPLVEAINEEFGDAGSEATLAEIDAAITPQQSPAKP